MEIVDTAALPDVFTGGGISIDFDRSVCLPPDMASVAMGFEAAAVINTMRTVTEELTLPVRALEMGTGSGVSLAAMLGVVQNVRGVVVSGLDINEGAVAITRHNLARMLHQRQQTTDYDIFANDWYDDAVWQRLSEAPYDVIMCNPPYLASDVPLMEGYDTVPREAVYAEGDGLAHYRYLLPRLLGLLSVRDGATLIARFPSTLRGQHRLSFAVGEVVNEAIMQAPPLSDFAIVRRILAPVAPNRNMSTVTISRSNTSLPPHMCPH